MANNEVNAVPAANDSTSSGSSTGPAAGPLAVSETNPRYFTVASRRETKGAGKVTVEDHKSTSFTAPFAEAGPAVLYLKGVGR